MQSTRWRGWHNVEKLFTRRICIGKTNLQKIFVESENEHAYKILKQSHIDTLKKPLALSEVWNSIPNARLTHSRLSNDQLVDDFTKTAHWCKNMKADFTAPKFEPLVDEITERRNKFEFPLILKLLDALSIVPEAASPIAPNHYDIWLAIDEYSMEQIRAWTSEQKLLVADHFHRMHLGRLSKFNRKVVKRVGYNTSNFKKDIMLHLLFLMNIVRKPLDDMIDIERNLLRNHTYLTYDINQLGVLSMAFFKTKSQIKSKELIDHLFKVLMDNVATMHEITIVNILKILRYSARLKEQYMIKNLLDAITPHIHRLSLVCCTHIALFGAEIQQGHPVSFVFKRFIYEVLGFINLVTII